MYTELRAYASFKYLQSNIKKIFLEEYGYHPAFAGYQCDLIWPSTPVIDVVLFGDAAYSLMITHLWPVNHKYRIWVLNENFRIGLCKLYNLPLDSIGLIPRERFLKRKHEVQPFPGNADFVNFVYCARTKSYKNFELTCKVVNHLQQNYFGKKSRFYVFTPRTSAKALAQKIPRLDWITKPILKGEQGENWVSKAPAEGVLINLSIDPLDDFNVSSAQAQELGWPLIVSTRGPFLDIAKNSVIHVPLAILKPEEEQVEAIADHIVANWSLPVVMPAITKLKRPKVMSFDDLQKIQKGVPPDFKEQLRFYPNHENIWSRSIFKVWDNL